MKNYLLFSLALVLSIGLIACNDKDPFFFEDDFSTVPPPYDITTATKDERPNGLIVYTHDAGSGQFTITERDRVLLFYTFRLENGTIVQSTYANGRTFPDEFGLSTTIRGFREGLVGAKEGSKLTLVIPPSLGYGDSPNSPYRTETLYYDILIQTILD
jgi:FKBP-type peptidyl-prolyl cis-trans isomerase